MGEAERHSEYKRAKQRFSLGYDGNAVTALFVLNAVFFLILLMLKAIFFFYQQTPQDYNTLLQWFQLPADLTKLSERPWTLLTYVFSDTSANMMRIIANMLWLWAFGYVLQEMAGNDKIIPIYIYGGLAGGIAFIVAYHVMPSLQGNLANAGLLGANTGTIAVAMATTTLSPNHKFFTMIRGGISIWILMAIYLIIDFAGISTMGAAHSIAHLGGAVAGYLFVFLLKRGTDGSVWMNNAYHWFMNLFNPYKKSRNRNIKEKVFYNTGNRMPFQKKSIVTQQRVDEILDKINLKGYHFLTEEEKEILKKAAEEDL